MEQKLDGMCLNCQHLKTVCEGSYSGFYSGCVLKNVDHDRAAAYIESMTELIYGKARMTKKTEEGKK